MGWMLQVVFLVLCGLTGWLVSADLTSICLPDNCSRFSPRIQEAVVAAGVLSGWVFLGIAGRLRRKPVSASPSLGNKGAMLMLLPLALGCGLLVIALTYPLYMLLEKPRAFLSEPWSALTEMLFGIPMLLIGSALDWHLWLGVPGCSVLLVGVYLLLNAQVRTPSGNAPP